MPNEEETQNPIAGIGYGVEHVAHSIEHGVQVMQQKGTEGSHAIAQVASYSMRNLIAIVGVATALFTTAASIGGSYMINQFRVQELEREMSKAEVEREKQSQLLWAKISFFTDHGRDEDQRRFALLESQKSGELALVVSEQGRQITSVSHQISDLTGAMRNDHDALTRLLTLLEKKSNP